MAEPDSKRTLQAQDKKEFVDIHAALVEEIIADIHKSYPDFDKDAITWFREMMEYNCVGGKMNRGLSVLTSYRHLLDSREPTEQEKKECNMLGWCIEWLQAFFLVADDIMDGSITRRGAPCWYRKDSAVVGKVGMIAINDSFLIESAIYKLLKMHFRAKPYYVDLLELLHETTYQTELGQLLDLTTAPDSTLVFERFSDNKHTCIVKYKTAFYSFYLPVAMAMLMAGIPSTSPAYENALKILLEMGIFFQVQDDYLDCYGDPQVIGKIGTDIQDNKCSWLVIQALKRVTPEQKLVLEQNYARKDAECEKRVKALYKELDLEAVFLAYEEESYARLLKLIDSTAGQLPKEIFTDFADKIYKRQK